jgi:hypothetical protein
VVGIFFAPYQLREFRRIDKIRPHVFKTTSPDGISPKDGDGLDILFQQRMRGDKPFDGPRSGRADTGEVGWDSQH